jgi:hypothetical protein
MHVFKLQQVYEIARKSGAAVLLQEGHHSGELWGLTTHPTDPDVYATAGDGTLYKQQQVCTAIACLLQCAAGSTAKWWCTHACIHCLLLVALFNVMHEV